METVEYYFNVATSNGCREMTLERFKEAIRDRDNEIKEKINGILEEWDRKNPDNPSDTHGAKAFDAGYKSGLTGLLTIFEEK